MIELKCSLSQCNQVILGAGVLLVDATGEMEWGDYESWEMPPNTNGRFVALHPVCFVRLFDELARQGAMASLDLIIAPIGELLSLMTDAF